MGTLRKLFSKVRDQLGHSWRKVRGVTETTATASTTEPVERRFSQRGRGYGVQTPGMGWLSPFDVYLHHKVSGMDYLSIHQCWGRKAAGYAVGVGRCHGRHRRGA